MQICVKKYKDCTTKIFYSGGMTQNVAPHTAYYHWRRVNNRIDNEKPLFVIFVFENQKN